MLKDLLINDRSYRGYDHDRKITKEELLDIVDHVRFCPSSVNRQPLKYALVYKEDEVKNIQKWTGWAKGLKEIELPHEGKEPTAFVVILQDLDIDEKRNRFVRDVGIVAHTILLAATEKGLGGCMIGSYNAGEVTRALELPENLIPMLVVAIGKPDEKIELVDVDAGEEIGYYRDENDTHYVPKRKLDEIIYIK